MVSIQNHKPHLTFDELTQVRKNMETQGVEVDNEFVSTHTRNLFHKCITNKWKKYDMIMRSPENIK